MKEAFVYPVGGGCAGVVDGWSWSARREPGVDGAESGTLNMLSIFGWYGS